jgi:hypothetical protein
VVLETSEIAFLGGPDAVIYDIVTIASAKDRVREGARTSWRLANKVQPLALGVPDQPNVDKEHYDGRCR